MSTPEPLWRRVSRAGMGEGYAARYADRFDELASAGQDIHGEVAFLLDRITPGAAVLDAGCGTGRIGQRLHELGYPVAGVDADASMIEVARERVPQVAWHVADLSTLALGSRFDLVVMAGNVIPFIESSLDLTAERLCDHLVPGGLLVCGYGLDQLHLPRGARTVPWSRYDDACRKAGLEPVSRHAGWDGAAYDGGGYCVGVHRRPAVLAAEVRDAP